MGAFISAPIPRPGKSITWRYAKGDYMNIRQIEVFRAVMQAGSITGAAHLLHVSQPGVSRMLAHIELQLGLMLFERTRGKLRPTPEAQALYVQVEQVYQGVQRIEERARELKEGSGLTLRVLASPSTGLEVVPRAIAALNTDYPDARIYLETQLVREMVGQLVRNEADIAISTLEIEHTLLTSERLGSWGMVCVFPEGHAFESHRTVSVRDLLAQKLIGFAADTPQGRLLAEWISASAETPLPRLEVRSGQAACALVAAGAGVSIVDEITARAWQGGQIGYRPLLQAPSFSAYAVRHIHFPPSALSQVFVDKVKAGFCRPRSTKAT